MVGTYLRYFTFLSHEEILELDAATAAHPERREAQRALARQVCTLVHGAAETARAEQAAAALFGEEVAQLDERTILDVFADAPSTDRAPEPAGRRRRRSGRPVGRDRPGRRPRARPGPPSSQGGAYVNNRREDDIGRGIDRRRPGGRALPGPPPGQEGLPPGDLRLTVGGPGEAADP